MAPKNQMSITIIIETDMEAMLSWIIADTSKFPTIPPRFIITPFKAFTVPRNSGTHTSE